MQNDKIQLIEAWIESPAQEVRISEELDLGYRSLKGIALLSGTGTGHSFRSITLGGRELFPKNFETDFLLSNTSVAPKDRFFPLSETAEGKKLEVDFRDSGKAPAYPYGLKLYILLSNA